MVKCGTCNAETGDDIPECLACADKRTAINKKAKALEGVKSLDGFGAVIEGKADLIAGAKRLMRD